MLEKFFMDEYGNVREGRVCAVIAALVGIILLISSVFCVIGVGKAGIKVRLGQVIGEPLNSGVHIKSPIDSVKKFDVKMQREDIKTNGASKDLQDVTIEIALNYSLKANKLPDLYRSVGKDYIDVLLRPVCNETIKAVASKYSAEELITKRDEVSRDMLDNLEAKLSDNGIAIENVNIINLTFSEAFNTAIEAKQVAQQNALKAEQDLARVKVEAEQQIAQARAEAESYKLKNQEITDKTLQLKWIEKWDGKLPTVASEGHMMNLGNIGN